MRSLLRRLMGSSSSKTNINDDCQKRPLSPETGRKIGTSAVTTVLIAAGVTIVLCDPTGISVALAGLLLGILSLAAVLFPDEFKNVGDCVHQRLECFVKLLRKLPGLVKKRKEACVTAWKSTWSTFCEVVRGLWKKVKGRWSSNTNDNVARQQMEEHFQKLSPEECKQAVMAVSEAHSELQGWVEVLKQVEKRKTAAASA